MMNIPKLQTPDQVQRDSSQQQRRFYVSVLGKWGSEFILLCDNAYFLQLPDLSHWKGVYTNFVRIVSNLHRRII